MKLHLPKLLRNALLACISAVAGIATSTVGTATMTGAALAVALAGQQAQAAGPSLGVTTGGNFFAGDYTFTFTLTDGCLSASDTTDVLGLYWGTYSDGDYCSNGYVLNWNDGAITLSVGDGKMSNVGESADVAEITENTTFTSQRGATFNAVLTMGETYTISNVGASGTQTVTLTGSFGSETVTYNGNMNGGGANTVMGSMGNAAYNIVVPNPNAAAWDPNWGDDVLNQAPARLTSFSPSTNGDNFAYNTAANKTGEVVHVLLNRTSGSGGNVYGGSNANQSNVTGSTWIKATAGTYSAIIGGSRSQWGDTYTCMFTGDTHILIDGATVTSLIGGHWGDKDSNLVGNTYITVKSGNVTGNIAGSSVNAHMRNTLQTGDTHIFIYTPLSGNGFIAGGSAVGTNNGGCATLTGNTNVTIDLSEYAGEAVTFAKNIAAGHYYTGPRGNGDGDRSISGSTNLSIDAADNVTFSGRIVGGTYMSNGYENMNSVGTVNMTIKGGTYTGSVAGGHFMDATLEKMTMKADAINLTLEGGTIGGTVYGGHVDFVSQSGGHAITTEVGTINVTLDGATVGTLVGGGYTQRDNANANAIMTQGAVNVSLLSGTVNAVYAAGEQKHNTKWTTESVTVNVGHEIAFGENATVHSGYKFHFPDNAARCDSSITGDRTLNFVGDSREYTGVTFTDFNKINVTNAETTATMVGYSHDGEVTKGGAGSLGLSGETVITALTVEEGSLTLAAGSKFTGALTLADGTGLNVGDGSFTMDGVLTLGTGLSITGDVAANGIMTLMTGVTDLSGVTLSDGSVAASSVFTSINGNTEIGSYVLSLNNGMLTLVEGKPVEPSYSLTWAPEDAATNHGTWRDQSVFNDRGDQYEAGKKYDVTFAGITNTANPEKVQISGELTPNSMVVNAGAGTYEFYIGGSAQSGIVAAADGITIASGTAIFRQGTLAMTEQTSVSVAGTLALDAGSIVDQDKVNIVVTNGGTLRWLAGNTTDYSLNGGLALGNKAYAVFDFGANNVQFAGEIGGAVTGTTIHLYGTNGQTIQAAGGVFGTAGLYLNGVNLALVSGAQYGNDISNNRNTAFAERITIASADTAADPTNTETILSGNNDGFAGSVTIGTGTTLVFASTNALGAEMALTGAGNVAFSDGGATGPVTHATLNTDDVYTGTTTVRNNTILNWGEATAERSGSIILDNGSTLVLNCGVANGITNGLNTAGLTKGGVTITSLLDEDGEIIPVQWNSADKTYTGLTTVSANTILGATDRISTGAGKVNLSNASSVLHITGGTWHTSWTNTVYGAGTVIVETGANHVNGASKLLNQNDALANLIIRGNGTSLEFQSSSQANPLKAATTITVEDGASFINNAPLENTTGNTIVLNGDGTGAATSGALMLSTYAWTDANAHTTTLGSNIALGSDSVVYVGAHTNNNNKIANIGKLTGTITSNGYTLTKTGIGTLDLTQNLASADVYVKEGVLRFNTGATVTVDAASTITLADGTTLARYGAAAGKATNKLVVGGTLIAGESADDTTTVRTDNHNGLIELQKLGGQGTLVAEGAQTSDRVSAIMVTGSADTAFDGTIKINQSNNSNSTRNLVLASNSTDALADAVIEMSNSSAQNNKGKIGFALGADTVKIEGLNTVAAVAGKSYVVSDASFFGTSNADMKQDVAALGDGTDRTLEVVGAGTYDYAGTIAADVTVKMSGTGKQTLSGKLAADSDYVAAGGTLAISAKGQSGQHTFTALAGGILDMAGYAADTDAALEDSVVAAGGVLKNLTLAGGMTLTQTDATSKLAGALTLSGGDMVYELNSNAGAYSVSTLYTCEAGTTLTITDATMVFTPDALLGYIDAANGDASGNYKLISGLASITGIENLKSNFSADSRAQHSFVEITESNGTKTLALHVDGNAATLAWTGETETNGNKIWDLKNTDNWSDGNDQTVDQFYSDDNVTFGVVMGDADNDPNTADVAIDQVVTVADAGVKIGTMQVTGGNYIFEGGEISSVAGMGDIAITGGNVTFNNSITTDGSMTITGAPVIFNAANSWTGDTVISGANAVVKVTDAQGLSTTKTTLNNSAELQLAVDGTLTTSEMVLNSGNIYAKGDVTVNNLLLTNNAAKSLNADTGKTMTVTVSGDTVKNTLFINEYKEVAGTVNMTVSNALTDIDNIIVGKGALNATFNGNVAQGGDITYRNSTTGSMTFNGTAQVGKLDIGNADVSMSFKGAATTGEIWVNGDANDQKKLVAVFDSTANISKITGNGGAMDVTVKGAANVGDIVSGTCNTDIDFQGGLTGTKVTVGDKVTNLSFGANSSLTGAITVNNAGKLALNGGSGVTLTTASVQLNNTGVVEVTGGMTLSTDSLMGSGTLKLVGSGLSISAGTVGTNVVMENGGKLTTTNGAGTTMAAGKSIQLTGNGVTSMVGTWTLDSASLVQTDATAGLKLLSGTQLKVNSDMTLSGLDVDNGATYKAANDADAWTLSMNGGSSIHGTAAENITVKVIGGQNWINEGGTAQGDVVVDSALTDLTNLTIGGGWANANNTSVKSLTVESGRVTVNQYNTGSKILIGTGKVDVDGASAVLNLSAHSGVSNGRVAALSVADGSAIADINLIEGSLENAQNWTGLVNIVDEGEARTYGMGNISTAASVHLGNMVADAATGEYTHLTNAGSLKLVGENTLTLINAMTVGDSVFGATGAVTLADDAKLHIDINTVLTGLLRATENTPYVTTFNLGGDLTGLQYHDNVVFDTALSLFNLEAEFGADGLLTLTQYAPAGNIYQSTVKQGDSTAWNAAGKDVYDSAEGYSAILIDKDTEIDLTQEAPSAAQNGLGMVLNNLIGTADSTLSITGDGDDLVTIANTVNADEYNSMSGSIAVKDADVQILHTQSMGYGAPVVNTESTYVVKGSMTLEGGELKLAAGKLQLDGDDNQLLGGVTVADDGQAQLILNGTTTLGGSINHAAAADMLKATGVTLPAVAITAVQPAHIELGAGSTTALADGAMVESGVVISGTGAATVTVAEGASAAISQGAVLTGAALKLAEGTTLTVDTTEAGGKLSLTGADIDGTLASTGPVDAAIKVTQAAGGTSTYAGSMNGYTGDIELTGAGTHKLAADATGADMIAKGTNVVVAPASGTVVAYRSLSVDADSTLTMDAAIDGSKANRKVHTTNGVTLAGDMNLTAHLSTEREGGLVFTGGTVEVKDGATINLVVNSVSDRIANALVSEGETCVTLAESATGFADVVITSNDQRINKYLHNAVVRVVDGKLVLTGETVNGETAQFHQQLAVTPNGHAGADLLDNAYGSSMKAINDAESDVKAVLAHLETVIVNGNTAGTDEVLAAVAGASSAVLGMAASGDVDRQLQAIRNRTTIMGVDQSVVQEGMPYFNAWINAEADLRELSDKGTEGGYELNSWGGTVGFDVDVCPTFTAGMALTAMYGDLTATGADSSKGDMSTYYLSAFARYASNAWTHTFVGTMGLVDLSMKRTVNYGGGSYEAEADTDGMSFGLMYEVGRVFTLSEDGTTCLQPMFNVAWRHTTISGYTEKSAGDAALKVDDQTMDTLTFGLGARLQAIVGEDMFNRTSIFECRLLAKMDAGDSSCSTNSALAAYNDTKAEITSAEMGAFGIEAGAGLSVPVGDEGGSLFMDASIEVRSDYTNMNATVGYRVNF